MKRGLIIVSVFFIIGLLVVNNIFADAGTLTFSWDSEGAKDDLKSKINFDNPLMSEIFSRVGVYVFGIYNLEGMPEKYSTTTIIILFFLIWLILFVGISDIITLTGFFTTWVAWVMGAAITIIAANVGAIQLFSFWIVIALGFLGAAAIFVGIFAAFIVFIFLSFGVEWAYKHRMKIAASKGRADIVEGMKAAASMGKQTQRRWTPPWSP